MNLEYTNFSYRAPQNFIQAFTENKIIKSKYDIIPQLIELLRAWSEYDSLKKQNYKQNNTICLNYGKKKNSRFIFVESKDRIITIQNPFSIRENKDSKKIEIYDNDSKIVLNARNVSILSRLFQKDSRGRFTKSKSLYSYLYMNDDIINDELPDFNDIIVEAFNSVGYNWDFNDIIKWWILICKILVFDSEYVRFDHDITNQKSGHPINHLDINLKNSFKIGLKYRYTTKDLLEFLNKNGKTPFLT